LRTGLRGRIVPRIDGEMHIDSLEIACCTKIIIIGQKNLLVDGLACVGPVKPWVF
jgi:hypothetical protein